MYIIFDTETTGLPRDFNAPITDSENWPRCIQIAWQLHDEMGELVEQKDFIIQPDGFDIPFDSEKIHGISTALAQKDGIPLDDALDHFLEALSKAKFVVGQNIDFDINIVGAELHRRNKDTGLINYKKLDTCTEKTAELCKIPGGRGGKFKLPTLTELHEYLFGEAFAEAHNASADVEATTRCFLELVRREVFTTEELEVEQEYFKNFKETHRKLIQPWGLKHRNLKAESAALKKDEEPLEAELDQKDIDENKSKLDGIQFSHLHNHTQFSILQSTTEVNALVQRAVKDNARGVAMTDSGNMMAAFHFVRAVHKHNKTVKEGGDQKPLIPIVGCEFNVCKDHKDDTIKDNGYQVVLLAKNKAGYHNLAKMSSIAYVDGFYYVPRIDKTVIEEYKENVIALTGGINGEIPQLILNVGEKQAEEAFVWWKEQFGDDFYAELMRHELEEEKIVNATLLKFCEKHNVKYVATNNTFYLDKEDADSHDILLCVKDGEKQSTPIGRGRGFRYGLPNQEFYFKSTEEMKALFIDLPEAIINTNEIAEKCEPFVLERDVLLPKYDIPEEFIDPEDDKDGGNRGENAYLKHITFEGAKQRYGEITDEIKQRLDFELQIIANTGYPGYFLIVQDFTTKAREMGVSVGPGRGSAAGSAVAYCIGITNVDPIAYDLLFERFLNPDRVSMPDIDIDFDDEGRGKVIDYVIKKYGSNQVAQIITYGTMAAKSSIRDAGRVLDLDLMEVNRIAKLVPDIKLKKLFGMEEDKLKEKLNPDQMEMAKELKSISNGTDLSAETLNQARVLEGSVRNTGIHACGVIITPDDITKFIPIAAKKGEELVFTQFDNSVVEDAGLLKMDFLGLKTLTLIKDAIEIVKNRHDVEIIPDDIPLDDQGTLELFQRGETIGVFQFESPGMQKYMKALKPDKFADLIAMNALYRPGPLEYIPNFIARKHGDEEIVYDTPEMEEFLAETYGITVYQEQVMLLSQKLAGFTKGQADALRKGMGKKKKEILDELKPKFFDGCESNGISKDKAEKIWRDWEAFAAYAFNKSHSTCYSVVAFHTAYLKAHYPAEYMASVLSNNMNDIKTVTFFMEECKRMGIPVLGPDINESEYKFTVNDEGAIRFGLGAIKGVGKGPVEAIKAERQENGKFVSVFDVTKRVDLRACNKKAFESLCLAGAFDSFGKYHRAQFFFEDEKGRTFLETAIKYGANHQANLNSSQASLFGESSAEEMPEPQPMQVKPWTSMQELKKEKEVVGIYISGHPLDDYRLEFDSFCRGEVSWLNNMEKYMNQEVAIAGLITDAEHRVSRKGNKFGKFIIEDYNDAATVLLFGEKYLEFGKYVNLDEYVFIRGRIQMRKWGNQEPVFEISQMELLSEIRNKMTKGIELEVEANDVSDELIDDIGHLFQEHQGAYNVKFRLVDSIEDVKLDMPSRGVRIDLSDEFLAEIKKYEAIKLSLAT